MHQDIIFPVLIYVLCLLLVYIKSYTCLLYTSDVSWLIDKFDYRNKDADWKTSKDALQRGMQKLRGGYPADPPFKQK